ncbi:MAG: ComF family protein [Candidatus Pacebacteria bacterium]|nr:ComF family protein [Candidatus Paceibacterota bacterium]
MKILKTILDIIFPLFCVNCSKKGSSLCESCLYKAHFNEKEVPNFIYPIYDFRDPIIRKAIWALKYKNKKDVAKIFAEAIYSHIIEELSDLKRLENFSLPILIPIPISQKRKKERNYNQSLLLAEEIISLDQNQNFILEKDILLKIKETEHQARLKNKKERLENLVNTFKVKNIEKIKNRNIILLDDVVTTGATITEAKKVLRKAGAKKVIAFSIAH